MSAPNVETIGPLTPLQRGMLHHGRLQPGSGLYVEQFSCVLDGALDVPRFAAAWQAVVGCHDVLRTLFLRLATEQPVQVVRRRVELPCAIEDWTADAPQHQDARFEQLLKQDRALGFDPAVAPLMRIRLVRLGDARHRFLWTYHHALLDGWSMPVLLDQVFAAYSGRAVPARAGTDFRDYLAWLHKQDPAPARAHWTAVLAGVREPVSLAPTLAPEEQPPASAPLLRAEQRLPATWLEDASRWCRGHGLTLNTLCQGTFAALLARHAGTDDVVHGMVLSGRTSGPPGVQRMAGLFIQTVPARVQLPSGLPVPQWLQAVQQATAAAERHGHLALTAIQACAPLPRGTPLFDTLYVFENYPGQAGFEQRVQALGLGVQDLRAQEETHYGLALVLMPARDGLRLVLSCDPKRFGPEVVPLLLARYVQLLHVAMQAACVGDLRLTMVAQAAVSGHARAAVVVPAPLPAAAPAGTTWPRDAEASAAATSDVSSTTLAAAIAAVARRCPSRPAWIGARRTLTFASLDRLLAAATSAPESSPPGPLCLDVDGSGFIAAGARAGGEGVADVGTAAQGDCACDARTDDVDTLVRLLSALHRGRDVLVGAAGDGAPAVASGTGDAPADLADRPAAALCGAAWRDDDGRLLVLRYRQDQLVTAAAAHEGDGAVGDTRTLLLQHPPLSPRSLFDHLVALAAGCTLVEVGASIVDPASHPAVLLDAAATRALARPDGPRLPMAAPRAGACWRIDARSATPAVVAALRRHDPQGRIVAELRWPTASLPHARAAVHADVPPRADDMRPCRGRLDVVDDAGRALPPHVLGDLAVLGPTVPAALVRDGRPWRAAWRMDAAVPWLQTDVRAWRGDGGVVWAQPDAAAGANDIDADAAALAAAIAGTPAVREAVAVDCLDDAGHWVPTVHVATGADADPAAALALLASLAGQRSVAPPRLVALAALPRVSGRTDRVALARGQVTPLQARTHRPPRDEAERTLHALWCELLKRADVGIDDDFFELGGDSLLAAVMVAQAEERLGRRIGMERLAAAPTIAALATAAAADADIAGPAPPLADMVADAQLPPDIVPAAPARPQAAWREVLLTGATGFLGAHLLAELLARTPARVHCLVRAGDEVAGLQRVQQALQAQGLWQPAHAGRIVAVCGELGPPRLGLPQRAFDALAARLDAIFHCGAQVNFVLPYAALRAANVTATAEVLRLACSHHAKPLHHVSTVGVLDRSAAAMPEQLRVPLHGLHTGGYEQSKWVAEQLVAEAGERGLPVTIYRPSRVIGHSRSGRMQTDDLFARLVRGVVLLGQAPRGAGHDNVLPVDVVGRLVVAAAQSPGIAGQAVHVINPRWHALDRVLELLQARGHVLEHVDYGDWLAALSARVRSDAAHPLAPLLGVLRALDPRADPRGGAPMPIAHDALLRHAGDALGEVLQPPEVWLGACLDHFEAVGHLPTPGVRASANPVPVALAG